MFRSVKVIYNFKRFVEEKVDFIIIFIYTPSAVETSPHYTTVVNLVCDCRDFYCDRDNFDWEKFFDSILIYLALY